MIENSTILVSGGAGFIGSSLTERLLSYNVNVIVVDNFNDYYDPKIKQKNIMSFLLNKHFKLYRGDICDRNLLDKIFNRHNISCVAHIAARAGVRPSIENPSEYVRSNIDGTINILENMKKYSCDKIVFASSSSVYGNCTADKFSENLKVAEPISPYAATKLACEQFLYTYSVLYNIQAICLRLFTVYGPRQRPDLAINKFIRLIKENKHIPMYGDGTTERDYTYIDDIVDGIVSAIQYNNTQYEILNLGGGQPISLIEMIEAIQEILGDKAIIDHLPMQMGDVNRTVSDYSKAKRLLGYEPKIKFKEGLRKYIEYEKRIQQ